MTRNLVLVRRRPRRDPVLIVGRIVLVLLGLTTCALAASVLVRALF